MNLDSLETLTKGRRFSEAVALRRPNLWCSALRFHLAAVRDGIERFSRPVVEPCVAALMSSATLTDVRGRR